MSYPGNESLAPDIQERILNTYNQTRELAAAGNRQEAILGCDFILRLDPSFEPARQLQERLKDGGDGPVEVADLMAESGGGDGLDELDAELPDLGDLPPLEEPPVPTGSPMHAALAELLEKRELKRLVQVAGEHQEEIAGNPEMRKIVEEAYSRLEAEPYLKSFLESAQLALAKGDLTEVDKLLAKAKALDPTHPGVVALAQQRQGQGPAFAAGQPVVDAGGSSDSINLLPDDVTSVPDRSESGELAFLDDGGGNEDGRIRELLAEGQAAFDRGEYQGAIDAWSRIFLIDIDNAEATRRIEKARQLKEEADRQVEEKFHEASRALDAGDVEAARKGLEAVLAQEPGHRAAREKLGRLDQGAQAPPAASPSAASPSADDLSGEIPELPSFEELSGGGAGAADASYEEEIFMPPEPGMAAAPSPPSGGRRSRSGGRSAGGGSMVRFAVIGGTVLLLVVALFWFFVMPRWDSLFPNSTPEAAGPNPTRPDVIAVATQLHDEGKLEDAIGRLERVISSHPRYDEAQELLASWREEAAAAAEAGAEAAAASAAASSEAVSLKAMMAREEELELARRAFEEGESFLAYKYFNRAAQVAPLSAADEDLLATSESRLAPIDQQVELFELRDWEFVLPMLWQVKQDEPDNKDVTRLIAASYYNLGVRDLQRGNAEVAMERFDEVLKLFPEDQETERHLLLARSYRTRSKDLLYRTYVKYVPFR